MPASGSASPGVARLEITVAGSAGALALDAVLLEDGSWLLTWAGFEGEDDEIFWSLVIEGTFTEPQPLTANDVPDIQPSVTAVGNRAILAWNQYDGEEYRVQVSHLVEGRWTEPQAESRGTFEPFLLLQDGSPTLLYYRYSGGDGTWDLLELDETGEVARRGAVPAVSNQRPLVRNVDGDTRLEWPSSSDRRPVAWESDR